MTENEIYLHVVQDGEMLRLIDQHGRELGRVRSINVRQSDAPGPVIVDVQFLALEVTLEDD